MECLVDIQENLIYRRESYISADVPLGANADASVRVLCALVCVS